MGAAAITLSRYQVAIHGTTQAMRRSIGTAASYGCIRMYNEDVVDLYQRVNVGTPVLAFPDLSAASASALEWEREVPMTQTHRNELRDRRRRPCRHDGGTAPRPRRGRYDRAGKARRLPARFPWRHDPSLDLAGDGRSRALRQFLALPHQEATTLSGAIRR